jgi:hypothetical protein
VQAGTHSLAELRMAYMMLQPRRQDSLIRNRFPVSSTGTSLNAALLPHMLTAHYDHQYHMHNNSYIHMRVYRMMKMNKKKKILASEEINMP